MWEDVRGCRRMQEGAGDYRKMLKNAGGLQEGV